MALGGCEWRRAGRASSVGLRESLGWSGAAAMGVEGRGKSGKEVVLT